MFRCFSNLVRKGAWSSLRKQTDSYGQLARISSPAGTYLLYLPCTWSILMAAQTSPPLTGPAETASMLALFGVGAWIMRGAGCTINDLWDHRIDQRVTRTQHRPLASGVLTRKEAYGFLVTQLSAGLLVLLQLNTTSILLGAMSLPLVVTYPFMKRITYYPQLVLGLTFNWGALLGFTALTETLPLHAIPLYLGGVCWTLVYDTIYAHQDKLDDAKIGVKSTALKHPQRTFVLSLSCLSATCFYLSGYMAQLPYAYFLGCTGAWINMMWVSATSRFDHPQDCAKGFKKSVYAGVWLASGLLVTYLQAYFNEEESALQGEKEETEKKVVSVKVSPEKNDTKL